MSAVDRAGGSVLSRPFPQSISLPPNKKRLKDAESIAAILNKSSLSDSKASSTGLTTINAKVHIHSKERKEHANLNATTNSQPLTIERINSYPSLDGEIPTALQFSPDGKRITYLKARNSQERIKDLWEYDFEQKHHRLLVDGSRLGQADHALSKQEQEKRERLRLFDQGIVKYFWEPSGQALFFPVGNAIFSYDLEKRALQQICSGEKEHNDFKLSPKGTFASFVQNQNIYLIELDSLKERQLTFDGKDTVTNGLADFIAQEEMGRHDGYWWSSDEAYIAFFQVDESPVDEVSRFEINGQAIEVLRQRYPQSGRPNAKTKVGAIHVASGAIKFLKVPHNPDDYFPRCYWHDDSETIALQIQSRNQKELKLLFANVETGACKHIVTHKEDHWVNLTDNFVFLKNDRGFVWIAPNSDFEHLCHYDMNGEVVRQLTSGPWCVDTLLGVDEGNNTLYFDGYFDSPLEKHLYTVPLQPGEEGKATPKKITHRQGWHSVELSIASHRYVDTFSHTMTPPQVTVNDLDGKRLAVLKRNALNENHPFFPYLKSKSKVGFSSLRADDGQRLYFNLYFPPDFNHSKKYPVVIKVYGGPGTRLVKKSWDSSTGMWGHYMAGRGFLVFTLDNRGSTNRGRKFESAIHGTLGDAEIADQKRGIEYLRSLPFVDKNNIGVFGWSYGGFMTLMMMMKLPQYIRAGVAVAPVTDWAYYDTHYTERYLGTPEENRSGYEKSNVLNYINGLKGSLMVVHGMSDDNVIFHNSLKLYSALQSKNKPFEMMNYPSGKHAIAGKNSRIHLFEQCISPFFDKNLKRKRSITVQEGTAH